MNTPLFSLSLESFKSAIVSMVISLIPIVLLAVLSVLTYVVGVGDIFKLDWHMVANIGVLSLCVGVISLIKSYLTDVNGKFLGIAQIK